MKVAIVQIWEQNLSLSSQSLPAKHNEIYAVFINYIFELTKTLRLFDAIIHNNNNYTINCFSS